MPPLSPAIGRRVGSRDPAGFRVVSWLVAALLAASASGAVGAEEVESALSTSPGIHVASFRLPSGTVYVNLPDDLAAGETFSVVVNPVPAGPDPQAREKQVRELATYGVELAGTRAATSEQIRTFAIPAGASALKIRLLDDAGKTLGEVDAPLGPGGAPSTGYTIPSLSQGGGPLQVAGPFDGDLGNSSVRINGQDADPIGESPRQLVVRGPEEGQAETSVEVRDRGAVVTAGVYRNVNVQLSAGATTLRSGQKTTLTIRVTGVEGLEETLPVRLTNRTPSVVQMEGGEEQTLCIRPDEVGVDGSWTTERGLTGVTMGGFGIAAIVRPPGPRAESWAAISGEVQGELRARLLLEQSGRGARGQSIPPGPYGVLVRGAGKGGKMSLVLVRQGQEVGALDGGVFQRMPSSTPCDREEATGEAQRLRAGAGRPGFSDLGFENDQLFEVRAAEGGHRLVLETEEQEFSVEADLAAGRP